MRKISYIILMLLVVACAKNKYSVKPDNSYTEGGPLEKTAFTRGVNLTGCFDVAEGADADNIWKGHINEETFGNLKSLGVDVVRVPMCLGRFVEPGSPDYKLQSKFLTELDNLLNLGEEYGITVIIDNHQWNYTSIYSADKAEGFMKSVWRQIATHCKDRSSRVVYELQNEPDGDWWREHWHELQGELIKEIREIDKSHSIIVCANPYHSIAELPEYEDDNLIYTIHCYTPMVFTHQGGTPGDWTHLYAIGGQVPFPYKEGFDGESLAGKISYSNYQTMLLNYSYVGSEYYVQQALAGNIAEARRRNARLFLGEFGVIGALGNNRGAANEDRCRWLECVRKCAEQNGVSWTLWCYAKEFGLFNTDAVNIKFNRDLNLDMVKALGFTIPPAYIEDNVDESKYHKQVLYADDWSEDVVPFTKDNITAPCYEAPAVGQNCIRWDVAGAWSYCTFRFESLCEDLTKFDIDKTSIRFRFKADMKSAGAMNWGIWVVNNAAAFDVAEKKHNWTMRYSVNSANAAPDGQWHEVKIRLRDFDPGNSEDAPHGPSAGHFDWAKVKEIQFSTFYSDASKGATFYLDEVMIMGPLNEDWTGSTDPSDPSGPDTPSNPSDPSEPLQPDMSSGVEDLTYSDEINI